MRPRQFAKMDGSRDRGLATVVSASRAHRGSYSRRRAAAIIELGVCLPLLVVATLGTIEACAMIFLKQTLAVAAFEGARLGLIKGSETVNVEAQCQWVLEDHNVTSFAISMLPSDPADLQPGDFFRVTVSAQCAPNSLVGGLFYSGKTFSETVELKYQ